MKVVQDYDDFTVGTGLTNLLTIKEHYPNFKCTAFTIPMNISVLKGEMPLAKLRQWAEIVNEHDWIQIAVHGVFHQGHECKVNAEDAEILLTAAEKCMNELGFKNWVKVFKAPYWVASTEMYEALKRRDWLVAVDRNQPLPKVEGLKTYQYNWSTDESRLPQGEWIKGHGHFYGTNNNIGLTMPNFFKLISADAEFFTITEYAETSRLS